MDYLQRYINLRQQDIEPEIFAIALAVRYIRELINHGGSDRRRSEIEVAYRLLRIEKKEERRGDRELKSSNVVEEL